MGRILLPNPENRFSREAYEIFDDFQHYTTADQWTEAIEGASTITLPDGRSGLRIYTSVDNEEAIVATTTEQFKFTANQPIYGEARILFTDSTDQESSLLWGFLDAIAADVIVDGGQTCDIPNDGAVIWKKSSDGGAAGDGVNWIFETCIAAGTQIQSISSAVPQSASYQTLKIDIVPRSATVFECRPFIDGKQLRDNTSGIQIMHLITLGTATDMDFGFDLKGGHANDAICMVDYLYASQGRTV